MSLRPLRGALERWKPRGGTVEPIHAIAAAWPAIVGFDVAANSVPLSLAGDVLLVGTRSSAWNQQLQLLSPTILRGINEHASGARVGRLRFRTGAFRAVAGDPRTSLAVRSRALRRGDVRAYEPAADLADALERVRSRIRAARRATDAACTDCGAPLAPGATARTCTPCTLANADARTLALERLIFAAPWLTPEEVRAQMPAATLAAYERARRRLLARWWLALERARTGERLSRAGLERSIASSYVLLQSRLPPDRITPAIVANLLGPELTARLFGARTER